MSTLVCDAIYHNKVEKIYWYTLSTLKTIVRLTHFLMTGIIMLVISDENTLPRSTGKRTKDEYKHTNAKNLSNNDVDFITDVVYRRNQIEVIEDTPNYSFDMTDDETSIESLD